jgi:hypothetical protein
MIDNIGHQGFYKITKRYKDGKIEVEVKNAITSLAVNKYVKALTGVSTDLEIKYLAIGNGNKAIDNADQLLDNEIFRTFYQFRTETANNELTVEFTITDAEAVGQWEELGIFVGSSATGTADTGLMLSRVLYSDEKTNLEEITIQYISRFLRV